MKFKGEPNQVVRITSPRKGEVKVFSFNSEGIYESNHPVTIKRLQANFEQVVEEMSMPVELSEPTPQETPAQFPCKKCAFIATNKGELMAHYRKEHPKK